MSVKDMWEMQCPNCIADGYISISATVWVDLSEDGTTESERLGYEGHRWHGGSNATCGNCKFSGVVEDFRIGYLENRESSDA